MRSFYPKKKEFKRLLRRKFTAKLSKLKRISDQIEPNSIELILFCRGEPYSNFLIICLFFCKKFSSIGPINCAV